MAFKRLLQLDPAEAERQDNAEEEPDELEDADIKEDDFGYGEARERRASTAHDNDDMFA